MNPVFVLFWMVLALLAGFLCTYITRTWETNAAALVLAGFVVIGLGLGVPMGNPWYPTLIAVALLTGLAWGASYWYVPAVRVVFRTGNHEWNSVHHYRETWGERLARWGFPSTAQMEMRGPYAWTKMLNDMVKGKTRLQHIAGRSIDERSTRYTGTHPWGPGGYMER